MIDVLIVLQKLVQPGRDVLCCVDGRILGQLQVDQQLGAVRCRKELLRNEAHSKERRRRTGASVATIVTQRARIASARKLTEGAHDRAVLIRVRRLGLLENPDAEQGRKQGRDAPRRDQRDGDDGEDREGVLARRAASEPDGDEPRDRNQRAGEPRKGGRAVGEAGRVLFFVASLQPRDHRLDRDHGVIDQETERDDEGA